MKVRNLRILNSSDRGFQEPVGSSTTLDYPKVRYIFPFSGEKFKWTTDSTLVESLSASLFWFERASRLQKGPSASCQQTLTQFGASHGVGRPVIRSHILADFLVNQPSANDCRN